jgi:glycosyltransferase involved in cell wall biosynthesis
VDPTRVRVLLLVKGLGLGGAERLLERAVPYLDRVRYDYQLAYLLPWKDALVPAFRKAGIPVHCLGWDGPLGLKTAGRLVQLLRRERIDLVHAHLPWASILARAVRARAGVRWLVYTEHNVPERYRLPTRVVNALTYRANDAVIAVSSQVAARLRPYVRHGRPHVVTVPNAVDVQALERSVRARETVCREFGLPDDVRLVVNVGNLVPKKGHRVLLAAARHVADRVPAVRFLVVGSGPLAEDLATLARRSGLDGQVVFTGLRDDATALIGAADVFVLSSLHEGLPVALLEAMALGRAVVATRVGGVPEVVAHGETGVLVEPGDPQALAASILQLLHDDRLRDRLGRQARAQAQRRYGMAAMVRAVEDVYGALVAHPVGRGVGAVVAGTADGVQC